jgi:hypothetical protein
VRGYYFRFSQSFLREAKLILALQAVNGVIAGLTWLIYDSFAKVGAIAGLFVFFTLLVVAVKVAGEKIRQTS